MESSLTSYVQLGAGYIISVIEGIAIVYLFKKLDGKDKIIENRDEIIHTLQEKRVQENKDNTSLLVSVSRDVLSNLAQFKETLGSIGRHIENGIINK